ncbi:MAG: AMP-binding protein [Pseudomonadota bacterium]
MSEHYDAYETQSPAAREAHLFDALPELLRQAQRAPAWAKALEGVDPNTVNSRTALAALPLTRKTDIMAAQTKTPPFGGFVAQDAAIKRLFISPGPVFVAEGYEDDPWSAARALYAAGVRPGETVANTFGYHMTPGAFILESGLHALKCRVIAAGAGNSADAVTTLSALAPTVYCGVPDYLNILLDKAAAEGLSLSFNKALVSGAALPLDLRARIEKRGVRVTQCYATADLGVIAYESSAREGLIVNEGLIMEIVRPGTGTPVAEGEVGEIVVTRFSKTTPLIRFATGDLTAHLSGPSPCGRTNMRIKGWMGRADQRTKVKGMFVDPQQIAKVVAQHGAIARARLVVRRADHADAMVLLVAGPAPGTEPEIAATLKSVTNLSGAVEIVPESALPNDGKVIADERPVEG